MELEQLYSDINLKLEYSPQGNYMLETWLGVTPSNSYATLVDVVIGFLQRKNVDATIIDPINHKGFGPSSQALRAERMVSYAKSHGQIKQAIIRPTDVFSKFSVESYSRQFRETDPIETSFFQSKDDAIGWIETPSDNHKDKVKQNGLG